MFVAGRSNYTYTVTSKHGSTTYSTSSVWTVRRSLDGGATWATVDSSIYGDPRGIGADAAGNLYVVGASVPPIVSYLAPIADLPSGHWLVRKSNDGGNSWTTVDDFLPCVTVSIQPLVAQCALDAAANAIASDVYGNVFVVGCLTPYGSASQPEWVVRENPRGMNTWTTVDTFQYALSQESVPAAVAADALGNVFVGGFVDDASGIMHWLVRKN
jgi:hypothetical protein